MAAAQMEAFFGATQAALKAPFETSDAAATAAASAFNGMSNFAGALSLLSSVLDSI